MFTTKFAGPAGCSFWTVSCLWLLSCCSNSAIIEAHYYVWLSMGSGNQNSNSHVHMASTFPTEPSMSTLESNLGLRIRVGLHVGQQALCHWTISQSLQLELKKIFALFFSPSFSMLGMEFQASSMLSKHHAVELHSVLWLILSALLVFPSVHLPDPLK